MPYVIAEPCIGVKDASCVDVCPVSCIYETAEQFVIHPIECRKQLHHVSVQRRYSEW